jgi:hypothetical protein
MTSEALLAGGYAGALLLGALALEWLSAHTHRRSLRYRTAGFTYHVTQDHWTCPEGEHLWPHEFDHERRLVRYRARAHICNRCPVKQHCTDSDQGRELVRPLDPWPHSEAGRFHRVISLMLVLLAAGILLLAVARNHQPAEAASLCALFALCLLAGRFLLRDLRAHPANFPDTAATHGLRMTVTAADGSRAHSRPQDG